MFTGFTQETSDFLWDLSFNNERPWFLAHKEQFERCLNTPFKALGQESWRLLSEKLPEREFALHVSRIYRDARRLYGRGPYKDHLWFAIYTEDKNEGPSFWFEVGAAGGSYGLGFWSWRTAMMEQYRRAIDANPARFERLAKEVEAVPGLRLLGEAYKRPKADRGEALNRWYNRKYVTMELRADYDGLLLSPELPRVLAETYEALMPMHDFLAEVYRVSREEERA